MAQRNFIFHKSCCCFFSFFCIETKSMFVSWLLLLFRPLLLCSSTENRNKKNDMQRKVLGIIFSVNRFNECLFVSFIRYLADYLWAVYKGKHCHCFASAIERKTTRMAGCVCVCVLFGFSIQFSVITLYRVYLQFMSVSESRV